MAATRILFDRLHFKASWRRRQAASAAGRHGSVAHATGRVRFRLRRDGARYETPPRADTPPRIPSPLRPRTTAIGAPCPLPRVPARVA